MLAALDAQMFRERKVWRNVFAVSKTDASRVQPVRTLITRDHALTIVCDRAAYTPGRHVRASLSIAFTWEAGISSNRPHCVLDYSCVLWCDLLGINAVADRFEYKRFIPIT